MKRKDALPDEAAAPPLSATRRSFLSQIGVLGAALVLEPPLAAPQPDAPRAEAPDDGLLPVRLRVNGRDLSLRLDPRTTLLDTLARARSR